MLGVSLTAVVALASWEPFFAQQPGPPPPAHAYSAEIVRDEVGVPHIYWHTDADTAFGVAFAHAEDDFSTLQDVVAMIRGRYGAIAGKDGVVHSQSVQPCGAATIRLGSPHYADQAPLFVAHQFKPVWFTREDVTKHAVQREVVSN